MQAEYGCVVSGTPRIFMAVYREGYTHIGKHRVILHLDNNGGTAYSNSNKIIRSMVAISRGFQDPPQPLKLGSLSHNFNTTSWSGLFSSQLQATTACYITAGVQTLVYTGALRRANSVVAYLHCAVSG